MSCHTHGCCPSNPCDVCITTNPCYEDCGCLNPTTFLCITQPGVHSAIGVTNNMTGVEVLTAISETINNLVVGEIPDGYDIYAKISSTDTTADYLDNKLLIASPITKTVTNASGNEKLRFGISYPAMISADANNLVQVGTDGKLRVLAASDPADIAVEGGSGVTVTGTGPSTDPFVISINPSITATRSCFDGVWRAMTLVSTGDADVVYVSGTPSYRYRFDGSVEFKGSATFTVTFGAYTTSGRKHIIPFGNIPTTCLTAGEQNGVADLKSISYLDPSGVGDQITQQYGYIIRKNSQNYFIEFSGAFISGATKTIVVNWEGVVHHPNI